ncbi:helix-turn-helix domain-containing protein [Paenibacillus glycanilyticus]|uniref:HTH araC/xylS-type domain-containing protein n=1 Tax=Paenibacillus glycanilyticus TaxID=126569 RepID=A0ABQ6GEA2_9BACL|nr:helix-turn-helix domain-containing protein [Paenibacillus glycanilyticus]GLX68425.1 hypothetical protein MU1_27700 [Paenibacillus glycanilyticus]
MVSQYINQSIMQTIDNDLKSIFRQTSNELIVNNAIMKFYSSDNAENELINYEVMTRLQDIKNTYPLIDSLYTVRYSDNTVVGEDIITDVMDHPDHAFIEQQKNVPFASGWSSVRHVESVEGAGGKWVISLIRKGNPFSGDAGLLIINITLPTVNNIVEELVGTNYPYVSIQDKDGQSIVGEGRIGSAKSTLSEATSNYTGWVYNIQWMDSNAPFVYNTIPMLWILVMVIVALAGIAGMIYMTYRNYRPVKAITSMIDDFMRNETIRIARNTNEIKFIENAMHTLIDKSLQSQELVKADKQSKKLRFFLDMLSGSEFVPSNWMSELNSLNAVSFDSRFKVIVIEIDHAAKFAKEYSQRDQELLKYVLRSMVQETLQQHDRVNWAEWTDHRQLTCVIASASKQDEDAFGEYCGIVDWVQQHLSFTVTIGVGLEVIQADGIPRSLEAATRALSSKTAMGINRVLEGEGIEFSNAAPLSLYYTLTKAVAASLRGTRKEGEEKLQALFVEIRRHFVDHHSLKWIIHYFFIQLDQEMSMLSEGYQSAWSDIRSGFQLEEAETVDEAQDLIALMMNLIYNQLEKMRDSRLHRIQLDQIRSYVMEHFEDPAMSLDLLSSHFNLNGKYISKMFKDEFGINFMDFVIGLRVDNACELLVKTDKPIQDIAELSGYTNSISFRRTFKKVTGLTPGEYRQQKRL